MSKILKETFLLLKSRYGVRFGDATIERVNAGVFMTVVKLSTGYCGISITDINKNFGCSRFHNKYFGPFSPGHIHGQKVFELFGEIEVNELTEVIRLAVMNALSAEIIANSNYKIVEDVDPVDLLNLSSRKTVCIVGAFRSYIRRFAASEHKLAVLELNENAFTEEHKRFYVPAAEAASVMKNSDVIIITGSTLANNTLDGLLNLIPANAQVVVVGPTASLLPDVLFNNKVNIIGATRITDAETAFTMIGEGAAGYHLFEKCAKKICIINE